MSKMYCLKRLRSVLASLLFIYSSAILATTDWQGPFIGAYFGGGFGDNELSTNVGSMTDTSYFSSAADINAVNKSGS